MTWADLIDSFKISHRYLLDGLNFDEEAIQEELALKKIDLSRESADKLTAQMVDLGKTAQSAN